MKTSAITTVVAAVLTLFASQSKGEHVPDVEERFRLQPSKSNAGFFRIPGEPFMAEAGLITEIEFNGDSFAGLGPLTKGTKLTIGNDGTLLVSTEGIVVTDKVGKKWVSGKVNMSGKETIVFLPQRTEKSASSRAAEAKELGATVSQHMIALFKVKQKGKYGFSNRKGEDVIPAQYDEVSDFSEGLALVKQNGKYGYIDTDGMVAVELKFDAARSFCEGLAAVCIQEKWGYINKTGMFVVPPRYYACNSFSDSLALVHTERLTLSLPQGFSLGVGAKVSGKGTKFGYIDEHGEFKVPANLEGEVYGTITNDGFEPISILCPNNFSERMAAVRIAEKWGFIDATGNTVIPPTYKATLGFSEGLAGVQLENNLCGYINKSGELVIQARFESIGSFSEGLAMVKTQDKWGFVDKAGKIVIPAVFESATSFSEAYAAVKKGLKWSYVDRTGVIVIDSEFDGASSFRNGLAMVLRDDTLVYIDKTGKAVLEYEE